MPSWRELAAQALSDAPEQSAPADPVSGVIGAGLRRLRDQRPPRVIDRSAWSEVVSDALRLEREGWASTALALGWAGHDLFGIGPRDAWEFSGLAVWLRGRPILMLDEHRAIVADGDRRAAFERGGMGRGKAPAVTPVYLWEFGR